MGLWGLGCSSIGSLATTTDDFAFCNEPLSTQDQAMNIVETSDRREPTDDKTSRDRPHAPQGDFDQKEPRAAGRGRSRIEPATSSGTQPDIERGRLKETTAPASQPEERQVPVTTQEGAETPNQSGVVADDQQHSGTRTSSERQGPFTRVGEAAGTIWMSVGGAILLRLLVGDNSRNTDVRHW